MAISLPLAVLSQFLGLSNWLIALPCLLILIFGLSYFLGPTKNKGIEDFTRYLNQRYPELEQSVDLLLKAPNQLSNLAKIQREGVAKTFATLKIKSPNRLGQKGVFLVLSMLLSFGFSQLEYNVGEKTDKKPIHSTGGLKPSKS